MSTTPIVIRKGNPGDINRLFELVKELAVFENALHEVETTPEQLLKDGFGEQPLYGVIVAELNGYIIGMSLYYFRYSTWKGKRLYIEDIIVSEPFRGLGAGKRLFEASVREARETGCNGMNWMVLDWNTNAIVFYEKYGAVLDREWISCALSGDKM